jgi:hypothetical protein
MKISEDSAGTYLITPRFKTAISCNIAVKLRIIPDRNYNPNYLDLIIYYKDGSSFAVRTNTKLGNTYFLYNESSHVLYHVPKNLQYQINLDDGSFKALTQCQFNGKPVLSLLNYQIVQKINKIDVHQNFT